MIVYSPGLERAQSKLEAWANSHHPKPDPVAQPFTVERFVSNGSFLTGGGDPCFLGFAVVEFTLPSWKFELSSRSLIFKCVHVISA